MWQIGLWSHLGLLSGPFMWSQTLWPIVVSITGSREWKETEHHHSPLRSCSWKHTHSFVMLMTSQSHGHTQQQGSWECNLQSVDNVACWKLVWLQKNKRLNTMKWVTSGKRGRNEMYHIVLWTGSQMMFLTWCSLFPESRPIDYMKLSCVSLLSSNLW